MAVTLYGSKQNIIQVIQTVKTDTFSTTSTSYVDVTGLSVSITPSSSSNKILVIANTTFATAFNSSNGGMIILRDSTSIYQGNAGSGQRQASLMSYSADNNTINSSNIMYLDSPATTSAITYKIQIVANGGTGIYINRAANDLANTTGYRTASSITVMEVAYS